MKTLTKDEVVDFIVRAVFNFIAELIGVGIYMFVGCMGCVAGFAPNEDNLGLALSFSFAILVAIEIAAQISGGHLNPILTISGMFFKKVSIPMGIIYILAQFCGSILGFGLLKALTPKKYFQANLCCTVPHPDVHPAQAVFVEFTISSFLVLLVCSQWHPRNTHLETISIKISLGIFCLLFAGLHYTGGSMNPARSFGPAVWNNQWKHHWIYWLGPVAASIIWTPIYRKIFVELAPREKEEE